MSESVIIHLVQFMIHITEVISCNTGRSLFFCEKLTVEIQLPTSRLTQEGLVSAFLSGSYGIHNAQDACNNTMILYFPYHSNLSCTNTDTDAVKI